MGRCFKEDIEYDAFLEMVGTVHVKYLTAIRTSIKRTTVFLKRPTNAAFVNGYNRKLLEAWEANIDVQFVLDTYACAKYCVGYILKSDGGGSKLLQAASKDVRNGNHTIREKLKKYANILINVSEISAQEAAAFLLGLPSTSCSRTYVFINTAPPNERVKMLKSKEELEHLEEDSSDVVTKEVIDHYIQRPEELESICLAGFASMYEFRKCKSSKNSSKPSNQTTDLKGKKSTWSYPSN
jgi:Xaa-Pro aminopeptidase